MLQVHDTDRLDQHLLGLRLIVRFQDDIRPYCGGYSALNAQFIAINEFDVAVRSYYHRIKALNELIAREEQSNGTIL